MQNRRFRPFHVSKGRSTVEIQVDKVDDDAKKDENGVVPSQPVSIVELSVEGHGSLRVVVSSIKRCTADVVTSWIGKWQICDGGHVGNFIHLECLG